MDFIFSSDPSIRGNVSPSQTTTPTISDLYQALHLAEAVASDVKGEDALPGLNYTRQQAFYINIAQVCASGYPVSPDSSVSSDSPKKF